MFLLFILFAAFFLSGFIVGIFGGFVLGKRSIYRRLYVGYDPGVDEGTSINQVPASVQKAQSRIYGCLEDQEVFENAPN